MTASQPAAVATSASTAMVLTPCLLAIGLRLGLGPLPAAGRDDDVGALGREALGDREPDADAAAGDDGDLAAKS